MSSTIYIGTNLEDQILPFWTLHFMDHNIHLFNHIPKYLLIILREEINVCVFTVQVSGIHLRCTLNVGHCMSGFFSFPSSNMWARCSRRSWCVPRTASLVQRLSGFPLTRANTMEQTDYRRVQVRYNGDKLSQILPSLGTTLYFPSHQPSSN